MDPILADRPTTKPLLTNKQISTEEASFLDLLNDASSGDDNEHSLDLGSSPKPTKSQDKKRKSIIAEGP